MKKLLIFILIATFSITVLGKKVKRPLIQVAILLDTSNSMDGLINQAKSQLWKIVNELATSKRKGITPDIEVALFEYGKDSVAKEQGYIKMISPLTTDLDKISEELFALKTMGGQEYCGWVIQTAVDNLKWSKRKDVLKLIFIAGNEPFTQGSVDYKKSCKNSIENEIIVNTIHCGNYDTGVNGKWKHGAELADGKYLNIDQNRKVVHIETPYDDKITKLGQELNKTYITYTRKGVKSKKRQKVQDSNSLSVSKESMVQRSVFKSKVQYKNDSWDLVDAVKSNDKALEEAEDEYLPKEMQGMDKKERKVYVKKVSKKRSKIQKEISDLNKKRNKYLTKKRKEMAEKGEDTFDSAVIKVIHELGKKKNFKFPKK